jgi:hypothetical protein
MLFFVLIVLAGCAKPLETTTVDANAIYDGFAEASRHHTMPYKDLDRSKPYHYFITRIDSTAQMNLFILPETAASKELQKGTRAQIKGQGKILGAATGLQVVLMEQATVTQQ